MVANITFEQVKNLLKQGLVPVNAKLEERFNQLNEIDSTIKFLKDTELWRAIERDKEHKWKCHSPCLGHGKRLSEHKESGETCYWWMNERMNEALFHLEFDEVD